LAEKAEKLRLLQKAQIEEGSPRSLSEREEAESSVYSD
jgi:hypothetical protein